MFASPRKSRRRRPTVLQITVALLLVILPSAYAVYSPQDEYAHAWTDNQCSNCHVFVEGFSHPIGVRPKMKVPADLPLEDGAITCLTCHTSDAMSHAQSRAQHSPVLRGRRTGAAFCAQCHQDGHDRAAAHAMASGMAHLISHKKNAVKANDGASQTCLSCHDGVISVDAYSDQGHETPLGEHPINAIYNRMMGAPRMVPSDSLDVRVRLFEGRVECASCHSVYSQERYLTVVSNQQSQLCLSCHKP